MSEIRKNTEESRYEILVDGAVVGFAEYEVDGDTVTAPWKWYFSRRVRYCKILCRC